MQSKTILRTAAFQSNPLWEQAETNISHAVSIIAGADADLVILPEMAATGFSMNSRSIAQTEDGAIVSAMKKAAIDSNKAVIFSAAIAEADNIYNRLYFIEPSGKIHTYNKRHLFRMAGEHENYNAGDQRLIVHYKGFRICPLICYDLRFPVFSRSVDQYDLLIYIASWPAARSLAWKTLLRARAIENQSYCIGVNRVGSDPKNEYSGNTAAIDYLGQTLVEAEESVEQVITADLSLDQLREFRHSFPAHLDADRFSIDN